MTELDPSSNDMVSSTESCFNQNLDFYLVAIALHHATLFVLLFCFSVTLPVVANDPVISFVTDTKLPLFLECGGYTSCRPVKIETPCKGKVSIMRRRKNILPYSVFLTLAIYSASCVVFLLYNDTLLLTSKSTTMMISGAPVLDSMSHEKHDEYIFIGIKTSETGAHGERLPQIRKTWLKDALRSDKIEIKFFTHVQANHTNMIDDSSLMVETKCKRNELACKTGQVFSFYLQHSNASWFCSFDDDNYVNIPRLIQVLYEYEDGPTRGKDVFIGRLTQMRSRSMNSTIRFGTGGAGYCINRNLVVRGSQYYSVLESFRYADDVAVGYVTHQKLGVDITDDPLFHSHLERRIRTRNLASRY